MVGLDGKRGKPGTVALTRMTGGIGTVNVPIRMAPR
jgi:hypothetical protein